MSLPSPDRCVRQSWFPVAHVLPWCRQRRDEVTLFPVNATGRPPRKEWPACCLCEAGRNRTCDPRWRYSHRYSNRLSYSLAMPSLRLSRPRSPEGLRFVRSGVARGQHDHSGGAPGTRTPRRQGPHDGFAWRRHRARPVCPTQESNLATHPAQDGAGLDAAAGLRARLVGHEIAWPWSRTRLAVSLLFISHRRRWPSY